VYVIDTEAKPISGDNAVSARFNDLVARVGSTVRAINEVYANSNTAVLIYRSLARLSFEEVVEGRTNLEAQGLILTGIEVALEQILPVDPLSASRKGSFRAISWYDSGFSPSSMPPLVAARKSLLDKQSGWLRGGPRECHADAR
jgi:hypothetical protein